MGGLMVFLLTGVAAGCLVLLCLGIVRFPAVTFAVAAAARGRAGSAEEQAGRE